MMMLSIVEKTLFSYRQSDQSKVWLVRVWLRRIYHFFK